MGLSEVQKLKRGLRDVSNIFEKKQTLEHPPVPSPSAKASIQIVSIFATELPEDSLSLNMHLASQIASAEHPCTIVSLLAPEVPSEKDQMIEKNLRVTSSCLQGQSYGEYLSRVAVPYAHFEKIFDHKIEAGLPEQGASQILFFDFDSGAYPRLDQVVSMMDKWIFIVRPSLESVMACYKIIKASMRFNRDLEYYVLYQGDPKDKKGEILFEQLSLMVSKSLGVDLYWLGSIYLDKGSRSFGADLMLDHFFLNTLSKIDSPDKIVLAHYLNSQFSTHGAVTV
ncbi:MAG: hypothetical protein PHN49_10760 [Candidatus Omnitrophica bacterium]|nr:hypothetical protein [Candidatus Omnitrophota bacterium]MDD5672109.1 hypothetical protein [Candidatus Omnitrophota bacterium]